MSDKEARVRLTLNNSGFLGGLRQTTDEVKRQGSVMASAFHGPMVSGLGAAKRSLTGLGSEAKTVAKFGLALGGSFTLAEAAKDAFGLQSQFKNLAFAIRAGTGEAVKWESIQADVETAARATHQANSDVAQSFRSIYEETGNLEFSRAALTSVGKASTNTGKEIGLFSDIAGIAFEKFNVGADQIDEALRSVVSFGERGGLTIEEIASRFGMMGASAKAAGASGVEGISRILGMATMADDSLGNMRQKITAVTGLLDEMANPEQMKKVGKELRTNLLDKKGNVRTDAIDIILAKTGGENQKINQLFSGPAAKLMGAFGKLYKEGAAASGKTGKGKVEDGLDAFHRALQAAGKSNLDQATWDEQFKSKSQTAKAAMVDSLNELENAFSKPEMIDAMKTLARVTPKVASGTAKLLDMVVNHPILAGLGFVGGRAALAGLGGFAGDALKAGGSGIGGLFKAALNRGGSRTEAIFDSMGMQTGTRTVDVAGSKLMNAAKMAGQAMMIAAAAVAVYELGKAGIDKFMGESLAARNATENATAVADANIGSGDKASQRAALKAAKEQLAKLKKEGPGMLESFFGAVANVATGGETKTAGEMHANAVARSERVISDLEASLNDTSKGGDKVAKSFDKLHTAIDVAATKLGKLGGGGTDPASNGPPPPADKTPGHSR